VALSVVAAPHASAATTCVWGTGTMTVTLNANGDDATFLRSGAAILVNGSGCQGATVNNTDAIHVTTDNPTDVEDNTVTISNAGGRFQPGATAETPGTYSEIEWQIDMGYGFNTMVFLGGSNNDYVTLGKGGGVGAMNLNANETSPDVDVAFDAYPSHQVLMRGYGGADVLRANGGVGTGAEYPPYVTLFGGNGADQLWGSRADDLLGGGAGNDMLLGLASFDWLRGGTGNDLLFGGPADDTLDGNAGADRLNGGSGPDLLRGGPDKDKMYGQTGIDTLEAQDGVHDIVDGGPPTGADTCTTDQIDTVNNC
jgi:Ca2+-binding RTX toxin-like protein